MTEIYKYYLLLAMDYISFGLLLVVPISGYLLGSTILQACNMEENGIHPIGTEAVYIAGEACTVNMTPDRSEREIRTDMELCLIIHKGNYREH